MRSYFRENKKLLSVYFTAGFPALEDTEKIIIALSDAGVDIIEIGIPFSDPLADGPVIQQSNQQALRNGMHVDLLFKQLKHIRKKTAVPLVLMSYANPVLQFGIQSFFRQAKACGMNGIIVPDLPPEVYKTEWQEVVEHSGLNFHFLISSNTPDHRIRELDELSDGFLYVVTRPVTTGGYVKFDAAVMNYFKRLKDLRLKNALLAGFGIDQVEKFGQVCTELDGGIIGSAFIRMLNEHAPADLVPAINKFISPYLF